MNHHDAAVEAGSLGNADAGPRLILVPPVAGVTNAFTVITSGLSGGIERESIEFLCALVIHSYRIIPHGGLAGEGGFRLVRLGIWIWCPRLIWFWQAYRWSARGSMLDLLNEMDPTAASASVTVSFDEIFVKSVWAVPFGWLLK